MQKGWVILLFAALFAFLGCGSTTESGGSTAASPTMVLGSFGSDDYDSSTSISFSKDNGVYAAGFTFGSMDGENAGLSDSFLVKYSTSGERLWMRQLGSEADDLASSIAADPEGNAYVTGSTSGSLEGSMASGKDVFIAKYSTGGELKWVRRFGSGGHDTATGVALIREGGFYVTGYTSGGLYGNNLGGTDVFVARFDGEGQSVWGVQTGTAGYDYVTALTASDNGDVFIAGYDYGTAGEDASGGADIFLLKYGRGGEAIWTRQLGSSGADYVSSISIGADGAIYLSAETEGVINGAGPGKIIIMLGSEGYIGWAAAVGETADTWPVIAVDDGGRIFMAGEEETADGLALVCLMLFGPGGETGASREISVSGNDHVAGVALNGSDAYIAGNSRDGQDAFIVKTMIE